MRENGLNITANYFISFLGKERISSITLSDISAAYVQ